MSDKITIGLRQRIPMSLLEMALTAVLSGDYSREYFAELAATEYNAQNRIAKTVTAISQLTDQNLLIDLTPGTAIARRTFDEAFFLWNSNLSRELTYHSHPYYEYLEE